MVDMDDSKIPLRRAALLCPLESVFKVLVLVDLRISDFMNFFHAALVASGNTYVDTSCVLLGEGWYMTSSRPGRIPLSSMNVEFSPPTTVTPPLGVLTTRPVSLWPRTKSLKNVYAFLFYLRYMVSKYRGENIAYRCWDIFRYRMRGVIEQNVGPISFLVDYTGKFARIVVPWCGGLTRETLDATECSILL